MARPSSSSSLRCAGRRPTAGHITDWRNCIRPAATPRRRAKPRPTLRKPGSATASSCSFRISDAYATPQGRRRFTPTPLRFIQGWLTNSARPRALCCRVHRIERLARSHEQAVALGAAEADVAADFGQANAADQLAFRSPHGNPAVADGAAGIAGGPDIAVDVAAQAVGSALHTVDHAI